MRSNDTKGGQVPQFFRVRCTHTNSGFPSLDPAWSVYCESHKREHDMNLVGATYDAEPLDGAWCCHQCARFDWPARLALTELLKASEFSHVTRRGNGREMGVVYHKAKGSPTGVRSAGGFDPYCPEAMEIVQKHAGTPHDGPQSGGGLFR
jgi:hypothetical protein